MIGTRLQMIGAASLRSAVDKGFFHLLSANFLAQVMGYGTLLFVTRLLSAQELGDIKVIQSYAAVFTVVAGVGLNTAVLKFCSEDRTDESRIGILRLAVIRAAIAVSVSMVVLALLSSAGVLASPRVSRWLLIYGLTIPCVVLSDLLTTFLQAQRRIKAMARAQALIKLECLVLIVGATWLWGFQGFVVSTIAGFALGLVPLLAQTGTAFLRATPIVPPEGFGRMALVSLLANGVSIIGQYADVFVLDHFVEDREAIGYYSLATIIVIAATQVTATSLAIATPYLSEDARNPARLRRRTIRTQMRLAALSVVIAGGLYAVALVAVPLVYGDPYAAVIKYLGPLLLRYVLWSSYAVVGVALFALGLVQYNLAAVLVSTPVGIALSYLMLETMGVLGVAWAQVSATTVTLVLVFVLARQAFSPRARRGKD